MLSPEQLLETRKRDPPALPCMGEKLNAGTTQDIDFSKLEAHLSGREAVLNTARVKMKSVILKAVWHDDIKEAEVLVKVGNHLSNKGHTINSKIYLYPEEALYLIDIGVLELTYNEVPMSIQKAYYVLLNDTGVSLNQYRVYYHLTVLGNKVTRFSLSDFPKTFASLKSSEHSHSESEDVPSEQEGCVEVAEVLKRLRQLGPSKLQTDVPITGDFVLTPANKLNCCDSNSLIVRVFSNDDPVPKMTEMANIAQDGSKVPVLYAVVHPDSISFFMSSAIDIPILL